MSVTPAVRGGSTVLKPLKPLKHKPSQVRTCVSKLWTPERPYLLVCAHSLSDASGPTLVCLIDPPSTLSPSISERPLFLSFFLSFFSSLLVVSRPPVCVASAVFLTSWAPGSGGVLGCLFTCCARSPGRVLRLRCVRAGGQKCSCSRPPFCASDNRVSPYPVSDYMHVQHSHRSWMRAECVMLLSAQSFRLYTHSS